ncbi:hypothetical protein ALP89_102457 [Pseudomonas syringae pv. persicae]|nr:hypothetical protein ALP89_102457 [Pseudomonas syringae pv. persicae]
MSAAWAATLMKLEAIHTGLMPQLLQGDADTVKVAQPVL